MIKNSIVVFLTLLIMTSSSEAKDSSGRFVIIGKIGYFLPKVNFEVDEFYGGGKVFSLGGEYNLSPSLSMVLTLDYKKLDYNDKEELIIVKFPEGERKIARLEEDYLQIVPVIFSLIYKMPIGNQRDFLPYIGGGIGVYRTKLKLEMLDISNPPVDWWLSYKRGKFPVLKVNKSNPSYSNSVKTAGYHLLGGFNYHLCSHLFLTGELKYSSAPISEWNDIDVGGITVIGGINYLF